MHGGALNKRRMIHSSVYRRAEHKEVAAGPLGGGTEVKLLRTIALLLQCHFHWDSSSPSVSGSEYENLAQVWKLRDLDFF